MGEYDCFQIFVLAAALTFILGLNFQAKQLIDFEQKSWPWLFYSFQLKPICSKKVKQENFIDLPLNKITRN